MGRIEDALRKLEEGRRQSQNRTNDLAQPQVAVNQPSTLKPTLDAAQEVAFDEAALRSRGPTVLNSADRTRKEYGQVKRPILEHAFGRSAAPTAAGNIVLVTSALAGEGKSLTALNLAFSLSLEKDISVVLIDADTVKPDLSRMLNLDRALGLTDLLADEQVQFRDVLFRTSVQNLYFVPAGKERAGSTELISSQRMLQLMEGLGCDLPNTLVVVDSSPLLLTNETPVLASLAGQVVLVVRANQTPRLMLTEALDKLDSAKPLGLVLNAVRATESGYYGPYGNDSQTKADAA
jgi:protein-tyrosine kinase